MPAPNFELISELQLQQRRDFAMADSTLLNPLNALPLMEGEWVTLDGNYKLVRWTTQQVAFPVHTERGRYDTQAIGKANVIFAGQYEAETKIIEGVIGTFTVGAPVKLASVTAGVHTGRVGIKTSTPASGDVVVGVVTKVDTANSKVRFLHMSTYKLP